MLVVVFNTRIILCRHGSSYFSSKIRDSSHVDQINVRPVTGVPVSHIYDITQKLIHNSSHHSTRPINTQQHMDATIRYHMPLY